MFAQIAQQVLPFVPRRLIEQPAMRAIDSKPDSFDAEQRTHARKRKSEVSQCFAVTCVDDVDRIRRFGDDRGAQFAECCGSDWRKARQLLFPQLLLVRTSRLQSTTSDHRRQ